MSLNEPPFNVYVEGNALETYGFEAFGAFSAPGLLTFGLVWGCGEIWSTTEQSVSTSWSTSESAISTSWASSETGITTIWLNSQDGSTTLISC